MGAPFDPGFILRYDAEPYEGGGGGSRKNLPGVDLATGTDWFDGVCIEILGKFPREEIARLLRC